MLYQLSLQDTIWKWAFGLNARLSTTSVSGAQGKQEESIRSPWNWSLQSGGVYHVDAENQTRSSTRAVGALSYWAISAANAMAP